MVNKKNGLLIFKSNSAQRHQLTNLGLDLGRVNEKT
jgi:hypothetical protein